uniref:SJCHGC07348 protein n=1 Tax=Schistosoma japonicum TaxID=6182 RepID=Q5DI12_SCHJA|nr:SJCHGC07348 protein [Schistosoma japonicum]
MDLFEETDRLHGSSREVGGLIMTKSKEDFKQPRQSLFGLDKLAAKKRQESEDLDLQFNKRDGLNKERFYRERRVETPSNRGGVSKEYFDSQARRRERDHNERLKTGLVSSTSRKTGENYSDSRRLSGKHLFYVLLSFSRFH